MAENAAAFTGAGPLVPAGAVPAVALTIPTLALTGARPLVPVSAVPAVALTVPTIAFTAPAAAVVIPETLRSAGGFFSFPNRLFQDPQGIVKAFKELLQILGKEDYRLALKAAGIPVLAFHNVEVQIPHAVLFYVEKIGPVLQQHLG
jgi:hypothetical protein